MNGNSREIHYQRKEYLSSLGLDSSTKMVQRWSSKWNNLRYNSKQEGHRCLLTFYEYVGKAVEAGVNDPTMIGVKSDQYQMGRIGDIGDYTKDNCRFITKQQNIYERKLNGGDAKIGLASTNKSGRTKESHSYIARQSELLSGRTKETHCGIKTTSIKISKNFRLVDPEGNIHLGRNLTEFCDLQGLSRQAMGRLCRGETRKHKGWTGEFI